MRALIVTLFVAGSFSVSGQKQLPEFGEIMPEELKMTVCKFDSSADAVILFDKGEISLSESYVAIFKRHVRIKIFNKSAFDWADHTLRLARGNQSLSKLKGSTYNMENGRMVESKMEETSIFKSRYSKYRDNVKFTLPNVKESSIIEYSYTVRSTTSSVPDWQFQYTIPCLWSQYETMLPNSFNFNFKRDMQGFLPMSKHEEKREGAIEVYIMIDVPSFKVEPYLTNPDDYVSKIHFYRSTKGWPFIIKDYYDAPEFGGQIKGSGFLKKTVEELTAGMTDSRKKMQVIYDYVKANIEWNGDTDRIPDHTFKKVLEEKKGSSSEINLILVTMLRKAGFLSDPVFLSTRDNGMVRPFSNQDDQMNDVICMVMIGDKQWLLDATDKDLPITSLPERCLNGSGLIASENIPDWINITSGRSRKIISSDLKIDGSGELTGQLSINWDGIDGSEMRKSYKELGEEKYIKSLTEGKSWEVAKSEFNNLSNPAESAKEKHQLVIHDHAQTNGPFIYVNPFVMGRVEENSFKSEKREYPVDFVTPFERLYTSRITVPDDFAVEELPKPKLLALPGNNGKFAYNIVQTGNTIAITSQFLISKSVFTSEEYPYLREFFAQVVAKQSEQIVLKKK